MSLRSHLSIPGQLCQFAHFLVSWDDKIQRLYIFQTYLIDLFVCFLMLGVLSSYCHACQITIPSENVREKEREKERQSGAPCLSEPWSWIPDGMIRRETSKQKLKNRKYESKREGRQADDGSPGAFWENCSRVFWSPLLWFAQTERIKVCHFKFIQRHKLNQQDDFRHLRQLNQEDCVPSLM